MLNGRKSCCEHGGVKRFEVRRAHLCRVYVMNGASTDADHLRGLDEASLNVVQRRCLAVLRGGRAGDELRAAAKAMLHSGGLSSREVKEAKAASAVAAPPKPAKGAAKGGGWSCPACTLLNAASCLACAACEEARPPKAAWECPSCTLANPGSSASCKACGEANPSRAGKSQGAKRPRPAAAAERARPDDGDDDDFR